MFWAKRLDVSKHPELDVNWQWRRAGVREALYDPARKSKWLSKERKRQINRAHYLNGLAAIKRHLQVHEPAHPFWTAPVDFVSYSGETIKRTGERINLGTEAAEDASRVVVRQRAKRRQIESAYTLAGYVSAGTREYSYGVPSNLARALEAVGSYYKGHKDRFDVYLALRPFRVALDMELPGAIYLAAHDGRPADTEYGDEGPEDDVVLDRYQRSAKAYNEQLRKLGYRRSPESMEWDEVPEGKPLPKKPLETEIRRLAKDARAQITYANRGCRRDFGAVWGLSVDTRSEETTNWQLYDRRNQPDPAEYDIEAALAEGAIEDVGSAYADPELRTDREEEEEEQPWKYEFGGMGSLAVTLPEEDEEGELEEDYSPDFSTHHAAGRTFNQRIAVQGFREFALKYEPEKYSTAHGMGVLPDYERQQLYPSYCDAVLLDRLGKKKLPEIGEDGCEGTFVRYEDEETGERRTVKTSKLVDLKHELDGEGPSRFGLSPRQREVFGCYYGTSDMTIADIAKKLEVSEITVKREMKVVRERLAQAGIPLPAQSERRGRKAA